MGRSFCICSEKPHKECCKKHNTCNLCIHCVHPLPGWNGRTHLLSLEEWRANNRLPLVSAARWKILFFPVTQDSTDSDRLQQKSATFKRTIRNDKPLCLSFLFYISISKEAQLISVAKMKDGKRWYVFVRYKDWTGETKQHKKEGFERRADTREYE